ncbi:type VI secretion protein IcmF/TssM N-terminal domain-containing protein [Pseudoalteromonas denitrificans]|uniref:Type VI protein secretion system component VasK n=1 Tax=Pseudoalteromonas denitrificans DSM 6059 TaxID=1123010 RepID=A0A1I1GLT6_9GAMM|nr:type VI secretion protein IcmF/TssM N-terminal domain-containing protein [Pseudoalteromonas denitrificans]SFC12737.1 Type VI protein secretion system component VasK [Pseudoalteromonas denitrificans DSM 6059]
MMTFTLTKKHLIGGILISLFTGFTLAWWLVPNLNWIFAAAAIVILIIGSSLWFFNRDNATVKQQKNLEKQDVQLVKKLFNSFITELKDRGLHKHKYRLPWYLYITHNLKTDEAILTQMGFRNSTALNFSNQLPVQIWLKNNAVILTAQISSQDRRSLTCIKHLIKHAKNFRSRQTLNGIITSQSVDNLISKNKNNCQQVANDLRLAIDETQTLSGQKLPIYVLFNQMAGLADFCQFFASLDEPELDGNFGALNVKNANLGKFTLDWFEKSYNDICQRMGHSVLRALDSQLSEQFRRSVVAAPVQFKQIQSEISYFLEQLLIPKSATKDYEFRGYFFTNTQQQSQATDPLTKQIAYQLGFNEMLCSDSVKLPHSIFVTHLFDDIIRPEAGLASINITRKRLFWGFQISYSLAVLTLVVSSIALLKLNFDYYQPLNGKTLQALKQYQNVIRKKPYDIEELALNVNNLKMIRNIYLDYNKPTPFYISDLVPNPQLTQSVKEAYHNELKDILLPSLVHYLEDELFVYETLGDSLQTAKLLNLNEELQIHDEKSWKHLKSYYRQSFIKEGHSEADTLKNLIVLMDDLYQLGMPKVTLNQSLLSQSKASIDKINTTKVLFEYINDLPQFSSMVDISTELGNNFELLYQFNNKLKAQFVPFIFTPQGFIGMDLSASSNLMKDIINNNKSLLGHKLNEFEINNLAKSLQRYYQREYVKYWVNFIDAIALKSISDNTLMHNLELMASKTNAPQNRLYETIGYYTFPEIVVKKAAETEKEKPKKSIKPSTDQLVMAKNIQAEFAVYHRFIKQDDKGLSELAYLHENITQVAKWLKKAKDNKDVGAYFFKQLTSNKQDQSLYQLAQMQLSIAKIDLHVTGLIDLINQEVNAYVGEHVNQVWQKQISEPFSLQFANKFPFNLDSQSSVNFKLFNKYFKPEGVFDQFNAQILNKFSLVENSLTLDGFTTQNNLVIRSDIYQQFIDLKAIQQTLYQQSPTQAAITFKIKTASMSADLLNFELFSERTLFGYEHGPKLWQSFTWPDFTKQNTLLTIFTDVNSQKITSEYEGDWAWLKLVYKYYQLDEGNAEIKIKEALSQVTLSLSVEGDTDPFDPRFFSQIKLPKKLL